MLNRTTMTCRSDWKENYSKAKRYCSKLLNDVNNGDRSMTHVDLLHDAYLYWHDQKNENLFEHSAFRIARIIKNVNGNKISKVSWYWRGEISRKQFSSNVVSKVAVEHNEESTSESLLSTWGMDFPKQQFESQEVVDWIKNGLSEFDRAVLDLKIEGYNNREIEKIMGRSNPIITRSVKNIKNKMSGALLNPFNGSRVKVVKRVFRKTYDANPEHYNEYEKGEEFLENEYYTLLTSKSNPKEGLLIKEVLKD